MKNVTVSLDDATYRNARRRAAEDDRSLSSVVREALQSYGAQESEFDRLEQQQERLLDEMEEKGIGLTGVSQFNREDLYDPMARWEDRCRAEWSSRGP